MDTQFGIPVFIQVIIGITIFIALCWLASGVSSPNDNYDNPEINSGYCNQRECF